MTGRIILVTAALAAVLAAAPGAAGQTTDLTPLESQTTFGPGDEARIREALQKDFGLLATGRENDEVAGAKARLLDLAAKPEATLEFRTATAKIVVEELDKRLAVALALKNRLAVAIVVARMHNIQAAPVLLKLLGDTQNPPVRYWAAKGLANEQVAKEIAQGRQGMNVRDVLNELRGALDNEKNALVVGALFSAVQALGTEDASDLLAEMAAKEAVVLDLSNRDGREAMKVAVDGLAAAFDRDIRPPTVGKQKIVAALVQILVRVPPCHEALDLISAINEQLTRMTGEKTGLPEAVKEEQGQWPLRDGKTADAVWLEQMNWVETLLKSSNKDLRLKARPTCLEWTPAKSAGLVAAKAE
jgi:hypothetical protein